MGTVLGFPARADTRREAFPVRVHVHDPNGRVTAELALTDAVGANLDLIVALTSHGRVTAYDRATDQTVFDSARPRLSWPDRGDPIVEITSGGVTHDRSTHPAREA